MITIKEANDRMKNILSEIKKLEVDLDQGEAWGENAARWLYRARLIVVEAHNELPE